MMPIQQPHASQPPSPDIVRVQQGSSAEALYKAVVNQRSEVRNQLEALESKRNSITSELTNDETRGVDRAGLETRLADVDKRIAELDKELAGVDGAVARAAAVPGAVVPRPIPVRDGPPEGVVILGALFMGVCLLPLSIAYARRIWRRGAAVATNIPHELMERLSRLDQAVDSVAIEVERISEGQRFVTRLMSEQAKPAIGAGAAAPVSVGQRDAVRDAARQS